MQPARPGVVAEPLPGLEHLLLVGVGQRLAELLLAEHLVVPVGDEVLGLAVGLACSFFIFLWVQDELRYDQFHEDSDQIYRVMRHYYPTDGKIFTWSSIPMPVEEALRQTYPEITHSVLLSWEQESLLAHGSTAFRERGRYAGADP